MNKANPIIALQWLSVLLALSAVIGALHAAEEVAPVQAGAKSSPLVSEAPDTKAGADQELEFTEFGGKWKFVMYFEPNHDLPKQRVAAQVILNIRSPRVPSGFPEDLIQSRQGQFQNAPQEVAEFFGWFGNLGGMGGGMGWIPPSPPGSGWFRELVERMPEGSRPAADVVEEVSAKNGQGWDTSVSVSAYTPFGVPGQENPHSIDFTVYLSVIAVDRPRLEQLVHSILLVIDEGFSARCQASWIATEDRLRKWQEKRQAELTTLKQKRAAMQGQLDKLSSYADLTAESLAALIAHKRMIAVDQAGVEARLRACKKILDASGDNLRLVEQVETVKITAEIELAGLTAKQETLNQIIDSGQRRAELIRELASSANDQRYLEQSGEKVASVLDQYREAISEKWAYAKVAGVTVAPILWLPASEDHPAGSVGAGHFKELK